MTVAGKKWTQAEEKAFKDLEAQRAAGKQRLAELVPKLIRRAFNVDSMVERMIQCAHEIREALEPFDTKDKP